MKPLAFILSILLLGLSVAPCADETNADDVKVSYQDTGTDHDHNGPEDLCSPLCVCHCCHSHVIVQQILVTELGVLAFPLQQVVYRAPVTSEFVAALLQPPQV